MEKVLGHQEYIPNSIRMNPETDILLITGPNMSGKSTYMRQLALTVVMAQIGCLYQRKVLKCQFSIKFLHGLGPLMI